MHCGGRSASALVLCGRAGPLGRRALAATSAHTRSHPSARALLPGELPNEFYVTPAPEGPRAKSRKKRPQRPRRGEGALGGEPACLPVPFMCWGEARGPLRLVPAATRAGSSPAGAARQVTTLAPLTSQHVTARAQAPRHSRAFRPPAQRPDPSHAQRALPAPPRTAQLWWPAARSSACRRVGFAGEEGRVLHCAPQRSRPRALRAAARPSSAAQEQHPARSAAGKWPKS